MDLESLSNQGRLRYHKTSKKEIGNLLTLARRDIKDAKFEGLSSDSLPVLIMLYCSWLQRRGYGPKGLGHHYTVFQPMKIIMGTDYDTLADYFDFCRAKRNITDYGYAGALSDTEAMELIEEAEGFLIITLDWLKENYKYFSKF